MTLDQTLNDPREFRIFSLALTTLSKSSRLLLMGGADPEAVTYINHGIQLISKQLNAAAERLEMDLQAARSVEELLNSLGIVPPENESPDPNHS